MKEKRAGEKSKMKERRHQRLDPYNTKRMQEETFATLYLIAENTFSLLM
jgi:hypothetical protein